VGLSLCHNIVETHGGRIWVEDAQGGGARFVFTLPGAGADAHENKEAVIDTNTEKAPPMRVLVVDDEVELGQTLADILMPDGHQVTLAEHGKKALEALKQRDYDLIISDLRMPVMDGPSLYRELEKSMPRYTERMMFVTGDTMSIPVREFLSSYALEVIEKPYSPEEVRRAIVMHLRQLKKKVKPRGNADSHATAPPA
jgi:two-component system NtrC family sensor kinase